MSDVYYLQVKMIETINHVIGIILYFLFLFYKLVVVSHFGLLCKHLRRIARVREGFEVKLTLSNVVIHLAILHKILLIVIARSYLLYQV